MKKKTEDDKFLVEIQKKKMTERWDNAQDEEWEKAYKQNEKKK